MGCSQTKESFPLEKAQLLGDTKGQGLDQVRQKRPGLDQVRRRRVHTDPARRWRRARRKRRRQRQQNLAQDLYRVRIQIWQRGRGSQMSAQSWFASA